MNNFNLVNLLNIYDNEIRKNVKNKNRVYNFEKFKMMNMAIIFDRFNNYKGEIYNIFLVKEPKVRLVMSLDLKDKVINHFISKYILSKLDKYLDFRNVAARKGFGTSYGINLLKKYLNVNKDSYVLKLDISKYFYNISHDKLKSMMKNKLSKKEYDIVSKLIDSTDRDYVNMKIRKLKRVYDDIPYYKHGYGLPIGGMSSQLLAVFYLNEVDHYIIHDLKIKHYVRFMDDFILIHKDKEYLKSCLEKIKIKLLEFHLILNPKKTSIVSVKNGFIFLGYNFKVLHNKLFVKRCEKNRLRVRRMIKLRKEQYKRGKISYLRYFCSVSSYNSYFK